MNLVIRLLQRLNIVDLHETYDKREAIDTSTLVIPEGCTVSGDMHSSIPVVIAGEVQGTVNVVGDGPVTVLKSGSVSKGLLSANTIKLGGKLTDVALDADLLQVDSSARVKGHSMVRYGKLEMHKDGVLEGALSRRRNPRDAFAHELRPVDVLDRRG